ncbi:MAG: hypothetical protein KIS78_16160 [Labilithrix sp.]|nr:hypothetical protein [Labilithrix sp.]
MDRTTFERLAAEMLSSPSPELEALGWLFAERAGLTDSIGGNEWRNRVADGEVSQEARALLRVVLTDAADWV